MPGFRAHDAFNLAVVLPVLLATISLARHGTLIGLLLWPGALFYLLYTYAHGPDNRDSIDWTIVEGDKAVLIECKTRRLLLPTKVTATAERNCQMLWIGLD